MCLCGVYVCSVCSVCTCGGGYVVNVCLCVMHRVPCTWRGVVYLYIVYVL